MRSIKFPGLLLIFLILFLVNTRIFSQKLPKHYNCYKAEYPIDIDGYVYDNQWNSTQWSDFFEDIEGNTKPKPDFQTRMKMLWDENYLYIAAELEETQIWGYLENHDDIIYRDNDFEVFVDPDGDGLNYFEIEINTLGTILDLFMSKPYKKGGSADLGWNAKGLKKAIKIYGSNNNPSDTDVKWTVEMAIPWDAFITKTVVTKKPVDGDSWKMNFSRVQWETEYCDDRYKKITDSITGKPLHENNWVWSPQGVINMHVPEKWGNVTFVDSQPVKSNTVWTDNDYPRFWVWYGGGQKNSTSDWERQFRILNDAGIQGFLLGADTGLLRKIIPIAKQYNIDVHAWFWTMNRGDAKPEWLSYNQLGTSLADEKAYVGYYKFMCPALPEVSDFIKGKMNELMEVEGLEGIHMDYIRYVDVILPIGLQPKYNLVQDHIMPEFDYGYHPYMRKLYKNKYGTDPVDLDDPGNDENWINFRLNELNTTVTGLRDYVRGKDNKITAAVFPTPAMSAEMVRQDWSNWDLDCYFPMVYHNFYNQPVSWIKEVMQENRAVIGDKSALFCGLYLPGLKNEDDLEKAIGFARDGGADGVSFFSYGNLDDSMIRQVKKFTE